MITHSIPFLISTDYKNMLSYIQKLSNSNNSRRSFYKCMNLNSDLIYKRIDIDVQIISDFCDLWKKQVIRKNNKYRIITNMSGIESLKLDLNYTEVYAAFKKEEIICLHVVENHSNFVESHMPMYDKELYKHRLLGKYMHFKMIENCINNDKIKWYDMWSVPYRDSGIGWRDIISRRDKYNLIAEYKYDFLTKDVKVNPSKQKNYIIQQDINNMKVLTII